jgi:hypothetical protein
LRRFNSSSVQGFKDRFGGNFHVSAILETSKCAVDDLPAAARA